MEFPRNSIGNSLRNSLGNPLGIPYHHLIYLTSDFSKARPLARPLEIYGNIWKNYGTTMEKWSQDDPRMIPRGSQNDPKTFWRISFSKYCFLGNLFPTYRFWGKSQFWQNTYFEACREVFCQSATTKMTVGTVRSFHGFSEKGTLWW